MGRIGRKIRKGLRKVAKGMGKAAAGPLAGGAEAARKKRQGESWRSVGKGFVNSLHPGEPVKDTVEGTAEVTGAVIQAGNRRAGEMVESILKSPVSTQTSPTDAMEDRVRAARDMNGRNARDVARNVGKGMGASAVTGVSGVLETGSAFMQAKGRPVPRDLKAGLERIFGRSLDYDDFTVTGGRIGRPGGGGRTEATTTPHLVYLGRDGTGADRSLYSASPPVPLPNLSAAESGRYGTQQFRPASILVHELVHIWQFQHSGADYTVKAGYQQIVHGTGTTGGGAYDWRSRLNDDPTRGWIDLPEEAQAELIQDAYNAGLFDEPTVSGGAIRTFTWIEGTTDWGSYLRDAVRNLHDGKAGA